MSCCAFNSSTADNVSHNPGYLAQIQQIVAHAATKPNLRIQITLWSDATFGPNGGLGGRRMSAEELSGEGHGTGGRQRPTVERDFPTGGAHLGAKMMPVDLHQSLADDQP